MASIEDARRVQLLVLERERNFKRNAWDSLNSRMITTEFKASALEFLKSHTRFEMDKLIATAEDNDWNDMKYYFAYWLVYGNIPVAPRPAMQMYVDTDMEVQKAEAYNLLKYSNLLLQDIVIINFVS